MDSKALEVNLEIQGCLEVQGPQERGDSQGSQDHPGNLVARDRREKGAFPEQMGALASQGVRVTEEIEVQLVTQGNQARTGEMEMLDSLD